MIGNLFYLCPSCFAEDSFTQKRDGLLCINCHKLYPFKNNIVSFRKKEYKISEFYSLIRSFLTLDKNKTGDVFRISKKARLRQGLKHVTYVDRNRIKSLIESPIEIDQGELTITRDELIFNGKDEDWVFPKNKIIGYTTNSKYFEFKVLDLPFFQIYFENESPLKYEDLFTDWFHHDTKNKSMQEHQPRIAYQLPKNPSLILNRNKISNWDKRERFSIVEFLLHIFIGVPIVYFLKWYANLEFTQPQLVPVKGPFILLMNHESYLDPIIISTVLGRRIGFFTKSTSFANRILQPIFRAYRSLPNRRYEVDPQVVRHALAVLKKGHCIGIFPEGERTWNGDLLPLKYSTIKFLISVQVPIVIVKVDGAFHSLPRWKHKISPSKIKISVQRCYSLLPGKWEIDQLKNEIETYFREI